MVTATGACCSGLGARERREDDLILSYAPHRSRVSQVATVTGRL